ncbi:head GIN domain-containing protein [Flavobacterium croceum]|uniref:Putative autotransporter adhesin-like protein n=1 Tax=Flavobacterium croceum DSM 17960 TaxID=1121886 RepID=A0A2S4NA40_9FLAO|nr:head GIN domain-containing protein [Flavobacterium croceum]POS02545.1 putative autotransporter adhesin-like protein [Flavobacterium croceum DSM 17960]
MKKILFVFILFITISCEKPSECFESTGENTTKNVVINPFTRLEVYKGIAVQITEGATYSLQIETGSNIIDNIEVVQNGSVLKIQDNTSCNWLREYGQTVVKITAPNIETIYSKTNKDIYSNGILHYPKLNLIALDPIDGNAGAGTGDFFITLEGNECTIDSNTLARYTLAGQVNSLNVNIYANDTRVNAENMLAQNCNIYHRGSNDIFVKVIQNVTGKLVSTGNLVLKNQPAFVNVQTYYQGQVLYN